MTIKELHLRYEHKDFAKLKKMKEETNMTWEEYVMEVAKNYIPNGAKLI